MTTMQFSKLKPKRNKSLIIIKSNEKITDKTFSMKTLDSINCERFNVHWIERGTKSVSFTMSYFGFYDRNRLSRPVIYEVHATVEFRLNVINYAFRKKKICDE